jgi:hypothetical protein
MFSTSTNNFSIAPQCPVDFLPLQLRQVVQSVQHRIQVHPELVLILLLGVMAEVTQGVANVQIPTGPINPLSLWILLIADSGEGKTPTLTLLRKAVTDFEKAQYVRYQQEQDEYTIQHKLWKEIHKELSSLLRKAVRNGDDQKGPKQALAEHMEAEPRSPKRVQLTYSDTTIEAFLQGLCEKWPNAAMVSDEASSYLKGSIANALPLLNQRWEISPLNIERSSYDTSMHADDPRVSLIWAMQKGPIDLFMEQKGQDARNLGTIPRFIIAHPPSMQGYRNTNIREDDPKYLDWFYQRCRELLENSLNAEGLPIEEKQTITFSPEAAEHYAQLRGMIEEQLRPGDWLEHAKDYAAKASRQVARIAAIFELFENDSSVISLQSLKSAKILMEQYTRSYINIICPTATVPQEIQDADKLYTWLNNRASTYNNRYIVRNDIQKNCPRPIRNDVNRLDAALRVLQQRIQIAICQLDILVIDMLPLQQPNQMSLIAAITLHRSKRRSGKPILP